MSIGRGENSGHTITYTNVVRRWIKLGDWTGKAETFNVPVKDVQTGGIDSAAVVVQSGVASAPKLMLGAAQIASAADSSLLRFGNAQRSCRVRSHRSRKKKRAGCEAGPRALGD